MVELLQWWKLTCDGCGSSCEVVSVGTGNHPLPEGWGEWSRSAIHMKNEYCPACLERLKDEPTKGKQ
mgnify:FL=1